MSLAEWLRNGWLSSRPASAREVWELLNIANRDLIDCQVEGLSPDWRLGIAYNAALQSVAAALAACGYRSTSGLPEVHIIRSLAFTIGAGKDLVLNLEGFRNKRHIAKHRRAGPVSAQEADEMFNLATSLRNSLICWLKEEHPELLV